MVAYNSGGVGGGDIDEVGLVAISMELLWPGERGFQQVGVADACGSAVDREETVMKSDGVVLVNPDRVRGGSVTWQERAACCGSGR